MKKKSLILLLPIGIVAIFIVSLFPTAPFDATSSFKCRINPLWTGKQAKDTPLTRALIKAGYRFHTDRGAEADPDGICFGDFGSDEYWVIQYFSDIREVRAYSWILGLNWLGHQDASQRFSELRQMLQEHLKDNTAEQDAAANP